MLVGENINKSKIKIKGLVPCPVCGKGAVSIRTSEQLSLLSYLKRCWCTHYGCGAKMNVRLLIEDVQVPDFRECPEIKMANKPLRELDPNQQNLPLDK
ncbi:Uncharacterised protein [Phocoenobacter uteri]|uniref:Ogr/Delta-like zinc finger n=1 Tax=Phocoenobacter uteri TaxID=146806 RepID=A0A379CBI9_9PAST|nr:hypothetical protein [Phocoenobacter uteri]MDG6881074.1 hypothetical protein [Phocoenobacter uteri]SUB59095.1 Uncharacterised protein [Phocoenobacter uteri]